MPQFQNRAQLTYGGITLDSNTVTGEITTVLSAGKTSLAESYAQGDTVTYVLSVVNAGATAFTGLSVTDDLGAYIFGAETLYPLAYDVGSLAYFVDGVRQATPTIADTQPLTVTGITVPAGGNVILIYSATVTDSAPLGVGGVITNQALIAGGGITPITVTDTVTVAERAQLSITKSLCPLSVVENGEIAYTFTIENYGNTAVVATDDTVLSDTFDPTLSDITVTYNGTVWTEGTEYTYDEATGVFQSTPGAITVPAATFTQDPVTGAYTVTPGVATVTVTGTV